MKELLKSDSICQSYAQMNKGPVFKLTVQKLTDVKSLPARRSGGPRIVEKGVYIGPYAVTPPEYAIFKLVRAFDDILQATKIS